MKQQKIKQSSNQKQSGDYFLYNTQEDEQEAKEILGVSLNNSQEDSWFSSLKSFKQCYN
jgi:hypothetical protein